MLVLPTAAIAGALALLTYALLTRAQDRSVMRASLSQLDDYDASVETLRKQELLAPLRDRALLPLLRSLTHLGQRYAPSGYAEQAKRKLLHAGMAGDEVVDRFLAVRVLGIALVPLWYVVGFIVFPRVLGMAGRMPLAVFGLLTLVSVLGPDAFLNRKVAERQHAILVSLPDILDLLTISVEAGLGFEQALDRTVASVPGPLSDEFARMLGEVRAGASRAEAMRALDERTDVPEVRAFVLAVLQADTFGISIGRILRAQADEMRIKRRQLAQEQAQKAPVKMLIPMVFCIFPALFVVVIGPAIVNIRHNF